MRYLFIAFLSIFLPAKTLWGQFHTLKPLERPAFRIITQGNKVDSISQRQSDSTSKPSILAGFSLPLDSPIVINSKYGYRDDPFTGKRRFHYGIDLQSNSSVVLSMLGGKVKKVGYEKKGLGNYVTMKYGDFELTYGHLSSILVSTKDIVSPGTPIGISGSTGRSTGEHLHLSLKFKGDRTDPLPFLLFIQRHIQEKENNITTSQQGKITL